jgi:hypothetical protein
LNIELSTFKDEIPARRDISPASAFDKSTDGQAGPGVKQFDIMIIIV